MKKSDIQHIIRELFRQNFNLYPENYPDTVVAAVDTAKQVAAGYWDVRTPEEELRDEQAGATLQDYEQWCIAELTALKKESIN